jgi:hypothetical protein
VPYKISVQQLDAAGNVCGRQWLSYRFETESAAQAQASALANAYLDHRFVEARA